MNAFPQADTSRIKWTPQQPDHYSFIQYDANRIENEARLDTFFYKLSALRKTHRGKVSIVHIGDSHLQADMITRVLRHGFQGEFGDGGRGLVFPYQLAGSNAPKDVLSSSGADWQGNRLTNKKSPILTGVSGFGIQTADKLATVRLRIRNEDGSPVFFNRLVFFLGTDSATYQLSDSNVKFPQFFHTQQGVDTPSYALDSKYDMAGFELLRMDAEPGKDYCFYGVSLEHRDTCGVLYHTIGVNGARYDQYNSDDLFWRQVAALHGDLFIVSMGTNEAQSMHFTAQDMVAACDEMIQHIRRVAPGAAILITTPPGSYFRMKKPNPVLQTISDAMIHYCKDKKLAWWDLYGISGGKNSALGWRHAGLFAHDYVHFTEPAYRVQGQLLLQAFANAYNDFRPPAPGRTVAGRKPAAAAGSHPIAPATPKAAKQGTKPDSTNADPSKPHFSKIKVHYEG